MPIDSKVCDQDGVRLDSFVTESFDTTYSRSFYKRLIDDGKITVNGNVITKAGTKLSNGDVVEADIPAPVEDESFVVSYVRPPFIYGKGCKGNYNTIRKIALKIPCFPTYKNRKSMIYIDNLCEFVRLVIDAKLGGILTPQNKEIVSTSDLVREIAKCHNKKIWFTGLFNWMIKPVCRIVKNARKAFTDDCYVPELSAYWDNKYCVVNFEESIKLTEQ